MASILAAVRRFFLGSGQHEHVAQAAAAPPPPAAASEGAGDSPTLAGQRPGPAPVTLAMPQLVATGGQYPTRGDGGTTAYFTQAMIQTFAGFSSAYGAPRAEGQQLQINNPPSNQALFSLLGTTFGGDGMRTFNLPNLVGRAAIGGQEVGMMGQGTLVLSWLIATGPSSLAPMPGMLALFSSGWAPDGWAICDGSPLPISQNLPLFDVIGFAFGGDHASFFSLPDLCKGSTPVGAGQGPGRAPVAVGQQVGGAIPGLGVNFLIATEGPYPPNSGSGAFPDTGAFLGQIVAYGGGQAPAGWALCDGSLQQVSGNPQLFELIGTTYGGDGQDSFALPDLRGLMVTGMGG